LLVFSFHAIIELFILDLYALYGQWYVGDSQW
jgi:hypothetical protein